MSEVRSVEPVKLFTAMISSEQALFENVIIDLESLFGESERSAEIYPFSDYTKFYEKEMGTGLLRNFVSFKKLIDPLYLADVKLLTNELEIKYAQTETGKRTINLDPGYIALSKMVLASGKDRPHRIYIGKGIYAEVTLYYEKKTFHPFSGTYPDYASGIYIPYLNALRDRYAGELKNCFLEMKKK